MEEVKQKTCITAWAKIYIAGPLAVIEQTCRDWCMEGACVTVTPTNYIYTMGEESGAEIGLIHYPRFPKVPPGDSHPIAQTMITEEAIHLGEQIMKDACQGSFTVMTPEKTFFYSRRKGD